MHDFQPVYCSKCKSTVGEVAEGVVRFKCRKCGTYTVVEIKNNMPVPPAPERIKAPQRA